MEGKFPESDWKLFRQLQKQALERFCQRALDEIVQLASSTGKSSHERYLAVYRLIQVHDERLAAAFDDPRRSTALLQLSRVQMEKLLTEDEFARFSEGIRASVQGILDM